jgi:hypothetical protein
MIKEKVRKSAYYFSKHADQERQNDHLLIREVGEALLAGMILEQYEDFGYGDSCLVVGFTRQGKPVHIVCGEKAGVLAIVTVYIPTPPKFKNPYERGTSR